ncbi:MAG: AraC family transcriptional regulator [Dysgonamonadaceae bacterium]|jgi:AraC-like DNA-binding protein|nr:AraC family transcriptional regulator [Dysgonamonadaceae bacterium]
MKENETIDLLLLNIARKEHDADWNWKYVNSPFARLYMVESGSARIVMPDGVHTIRPEFLYLVPPFVMHSYENPDFFVLYYLHIYDKNNLLDLLDFPFEVNATEFDYTLIKRLLCINPGRELATSDPLIYDNFQNLIKGISDVDKLSIHHVMETRGILLQLFSKFMEKASTKQTITDERIIKAVNYIRTRIDSNISIEDLSGLFYLTNDHFIRLFKKELQCTPLQYINRKKIEKAQLLLTMGKSTVKDIALSLSFSDVSHFFKTFKKLTGVSPNHFQQLQNRY